MFFAIHFRKFAFKTARKTAEEMALGSTPQRELSNRASLFKRSRIYVHLRLPAFANSPASSDRVADRLGARPRLFEVPPDDNSAAGFARPGHKKTPADPSGLRQLAF